METRDRSTPAMLYAGVVGAVLVVAGIIGFFYNAEFTSDKGVRDAVFGVLDVNGWHNLVHILTGVLGLLVGSGDSILSIIPVNTEDNILHLMLGVAGVWAAVATPAGEAVRPAAQT